MFKFRFNRIQVIFLIIFGIFLLSSSIIVYSSQSDFYTPRTCSQIFSPNYCNSTTLDDVIFSSDKLTCNGTQYCSGGTCSLWPSVKEVYINVTSFFTETGISVTCEFAQNAAGGNYFEYIWYYNTSHWINIQNFTNSTAGTFNRSVAFKLNSSVETPHIVRCILSYNLTLGRGEIPNECANISFSSYFDNDDVNFTVTDHFKYDPWNLSISDNENLTRSQTVLAYAHWNKNFSYAQIRHNGTGSPQNYTISSYTGNWTNYTLNLSNTTEFSTPGLINVSYIWANDTYGLENYTSPIHSFYLWGSSKVSNITINDSVIYNESTVQTFCKVDDVNTNSGIPNYNVSFYKNDTPLGNVSTNGTGWANYSYTANVNTLPTTLNIKCNITDDTQKYYNASSDNSKNTTIEIVNIDIQIPINTTSLVLGNTVEITANVTGNASTITLLQANISYTNLTNSEYVQTFELRNLTLKQTYSNTSHEYNLTYTPTRPSNYTVNITVNADKGRWNITSFKVWGSSRINQTYLNQSTIYNNTASQIFCKVLDSNYQPIPNYNVSFYKNDTPLGNVSTNGTGWANYSSTFTVPTFPDYLNLTCNITDSATLYYNKTAQNSNSTILGVVNPYEVLLGNVYFKRGEGSVLNKTNRLDTSFAFYLNVYDTLQMDSVTLNLTYPNNAIKINLSMIGETSAGWKTWNYTFNNASYPLNMTGTYTIGIIAKNSYGTQNISTNYITFYVNETYDINSSESSTYMRGENVTVNALDIYGNRVDNVNWTVNVTKINETYNYSAQTTIFNYTVLPNDPVGNYTVLVINATKDGNHGNLTVNFNVSNELNVSISTSASSPTLRGITITGNVSVYNARSTLHNSTFIANISCHNQPGSYIMSPLSFSSSNASFICYSPQDYGDYSITVNLTDIHNNTGIGIYNLTTESRPPSGDNLGGGGGGGGGGGNITIIQNVTVNATAEIRDFNFTVQNSEIQVYRGEDGTIVGEVANTGNTNLTLSSSIFLNSTCCVVSMVPSKFNLKVGGTEISFTVSIHVNTSTEPDKEYFFDIKLKSETLEKSKRIKIIVKENPVISGLQQVSGQVSEIESKIKEYKRVGLNIVDLEGLLNKIKETLSGSQSHISKDDINTLKSNENSVKLSLTQINDQLNKLAFIKTVYENKWNIISGIVIGIVSSYLLILVFIPYFELGMEIRKLRFEEASLIKSRVEAEKSYFLRRIDDKTFRTVLSGKQGQIYKTTADIKLKEQARSQILRERVNPLYLVKLIKEKTSKMRTKKQINQL
jgi:hypothetical protein